METMLNPYQISQSYPQAINPALLQNGAAQINKMAVFPPGGFYPAYPGAGQIMAPRPPAAQQYIQQMIGSVMSGINQLMQKLGQLLSAAFGTGTLPAGPVNSGGMLDPLTGQVTNFKEWQEEQELMQKVNNGLNTVVGWGNKIGDYVKKGSNILGAVKDGLLGVVSTGASIFGAGAVSGLIGKGVSLIKKWF